MGGGGILPSIENFAKGTAATMATLSTLSVGLIWFGQNYLIYPSAFPQGSREVVDKPSSYNLPYEDLELRTCDGVLLKNYLIPQKDPNGIIPDDEYAATKPTVIMFHGNGGNLGHRIPLALAFYRMHQCNVLMMCYRGYGLSEGSPSEKGLQIDAQTGLEYLLNHPTYRNTQIILYGQSLGGAVAIDLASRNPDKIAALILENTFTSLPNMVNHIFPALSRVAFLCHQKWDSQSKIGTIPATTPILMLSGRKDEVVPKEHMHALWEAVARRGEKKRGTLATGSASGSGKEAGGSDFQVGLERAKFVEFKSGHHNDTCAEPGYWSAIGEFLKSVRNPQPLSPPSASSSDSEGSSERKPSRPRSSSDDDDSLPKFAPPLPSKF